MQDRGDVVTSEAELRALVGQPAPVAPAKQRDRLHGLDRAWLAASPFCLLATAGADGRCDVSPKGDPPGFVRVLDDRTVAVPERPGNRRVDGFLDVLAMRSELWDTATWDGGERAVGAGVPSRAHLAKALERPDTPLEELQRYHGSRYADGLYR
ncbi:pyridoxamine 5'-phosphate oxidase family protein [Quadrisphaera sp. KR29]|uniref:pyridoxamine 5'-phosphate oxidase family protein n=1 Tax=Quadrisphaera sp. KR29 TaxID=3461391 RepID=UPI004043B47D